MAPRAIGPGSASRLLRPFCAAFVALLGASACTSTTDSLGYDDISLSSGGNSGTGANGGSSATAGGGAATAGGGGLKPIDGPGFYPDLLDQLLGIGPDESENRIRNAYDQLFHGTDKDEPIYFHDPEDKTQAYIRDIFHDDIRTEGMGLAMLISVELEDRHEEFNKLWSYAKNKLRVRDGSRAGYFESVCDDVTDTSKTACLDPYGMQQMAMALIFAHERWGSDGGFDYEEDALALLDVMLRKEEMNGGVVDNVTNVFDSRTLLPFDEPDASVTWTRPSIVMPAYYDLWAEATGNQFWTDAADSARLFLVSTPNPDTGLIPLRAHMNGMPFTGYDIYNPEAYRVMLNIVLDVIWSGENQWAVEECNQVLTFFGKQGMDTGTIYKIDGELLKPDFEDALRLVNGVVALVSNLEDLEPFVREVWEFPTPKGEARYYQGLLQLYALVVLSGRMRVL